MRRQSIARKWARTPTKEKQSGFMELSAMASVAIFMMGVAVMFMAFKQQKEMAEAGKLAQEIKELTSAVASKVAKQRHLLTAGADRVIEGWAWLQPDTCATADPVLSDEVSHIPCGYRPDGLIDNILMRTTIKDAADSSTPIEATIEFGHKDASGNWVVPKDGSGKSLYARMGQALVFAEGEPILNAEQGISRNTLDIFIDFDPLMENSGVIVARINTASQGNDLFLRPDMLTEMVTDFSLRNETLNQNFDLIEAKDIYWGSTNSTDGLNSAKLHHDGASAHIQLPGVNSSIVFNSNGTQNILSHDAVTGALKASGDMVVGQDLAVLRNMQAVGNITTTSGDFIANAGGVAVTDDIVTSAGNIEATVGTITAGSNITSTSGNIVADVGDIIATQGAVSAGVDKDVTASGGLHSLQRSFQDAYTVTHNAIVPKAVCDNGMTSTIYLSQINVIDPYTADGLTHPVEGVDPRVSSSGSNWLFQLYLYVDGTWRPAGTDSRYTIFTKCD